MSFINAHLDDIRDYTSNYNNKQSNYNTAIIKHADSMILLKIVSLFSLAMIIANIVLYYQINAVQEKNNDIKAQHISEENKINDLNIKIEQINQERIQAKDDARQNEMKKEILMSSINKMTNDYVSKSKLDDIKTKLSQIKLAGQMNTDSKIDYASHITHLKYDISLKTKELEKLTTDIKLLKRRIEGHINEENAKCNSVLIKNDNQYKLLMSWVGDNKDYNFELLYRGSDNKFNWEEFHNVCDQLYINNTLVLIQLNNGDIVGGFTYNNWSGHGFKRDERAFVFNLINEKKYKVNYSNQAIYTSPQFGPVFGRGDLSVFSEYEVSCGFPRSYRKDDREYKLTNGKVFSYLKEIEVFTLRSIVKQSNNKNYDVINVL